MKKGTIRIVIGIILIVLQLLSLLGNARSGVGIKISFESLAVFIYDLIATVSYCFVGFLGLVLMISGIVARTKEET